jgi:hypothetical protein
MSDCCSDPDGAAAGAAQTAPRQAQLSMYASLPVDDEYHFTGGAIHIDHDLANQRANDALPQALIGVGIIPPRLQLGGTTPPTPHAKELSRGLALAHAARSGVQSLARAATLSSTDALARRRRGGFPDPLHRIPSERDAAL